jgi:hypothetical protein
MRALTAQELLDIWERGFAMTPVQRGLAFLTEACPEMTSQALAELSIGQRDDLLLSLRERLFGAQVSGLATCPKCGERLELNFRVSDIRVAKNGKGDKGQGEGEFPNPYPLSPGSYPLSLEFPGFMVHFRIPNSLDLATIAGNQDLDQSRKMLLECCLKSVDAQGSPVAPSDLPMEVIEAVQERMAQVDPLADIAFSLTCPSCSHQWQLLFDALTLLWNEINAWAYRILREVHILASAYGWREADILSLSPWRRQAYLDMVGG